MLTQRSQRRRSPRPASGPRQAQLAQQRNRGRAARCRSARTRVRARIATETCRLSSTPPSLRCRPLGHPPCRDGPSFAKRRYAKRTSAGLAVKSTSNVRLACAISSASRNSISTVAKLVGAVGPTQRKLNPPPNSASSVSRQRSTASTASVFTRSAMCKTMRSATIGWTMVSIATVRSASDKRPASAARRRSRASLTSPPSAARPAGVTSSAFFVNRALSRAMGSRWRCRRIRRSGPR